MDKIQFRVSTVGMTANTALAAKVSELFQNYKEGKSCIDADGKNHDPRAVAMHIIFEYTNAQIEAMEVNHV